MLEKVLTPYYRNGRNKLSTDVFDDMFGLMNQLSFPLERRADKFKVINKNNEYLIVGEIPGFSKDEINVAVENNVLKISGRHEISQEERDYLSKDSAIFESSFTLPTNVNADEISAERQLLRGLAPELAPSP